MSEGVMRLIAEAPGDWRNAAFQAVACELAYLPDPAGREAFRARLGLDARLIAVDNTQAYVAESDAAVVVAFRGSEDPASVDGLKDWLLTNASNFLILPEGRIGTDFAAAGVGARFHRGFLGALAEIWEPLFAAVDAAQRRRERPLWVTGHSLGGALALLAAWRFQQQFLAVHAVHTFGAPMVGNDAAAAAFQREFPGRIFRYVDALDLVPVLPTVSLIANTYTHCLAEQLLGTRPTGDAEDLPATELCRQLASRTLDGLLDATLIDDIWNGLQHRISHHMVANYQAQIAEQARSRA